MGPTISGGDSVNAYLPIFTLFVLAALFAGLSFFASRLLAPSNPNAAKSAPYECGIIPTREPPQRFPVRFYLVAMIFIIFDIEIIFIYPWATIFSDKGFSLFGLGEMLVFALFVFASFLYLVSNGALDWGPVKRLRVFRTSGRTSESTIRRVSSPGQ